MSLQVQIKEQIKDAMKAKDQVKLGVVKGLSASFINELVPMKKMPTDELTDEEVLNVIRRAVKQRKDSIDQFTKGGRPELAESEQAELSVLETYLPAMMSREDVLKLAQAKMTEMGIDPSTDSHSSPSGSESRTGQAKSKTLNTSEASVGRPAKAGLAGMFMGSLMKDLKGKADGDVVKSVVDELLA